MTASIQTDVLLSQFSVLAYKGRAYLDNSANLPTGWKLVLSDDQNPPFAAFAFKNEATGQVVIAYRGTDGVSDTPANTAILTGGWSTQFDQGMKFAESVLSNSEIVPSSSDTSNILVTGHSLGGAIAQIVAQAYSLDGSAIDPGAAGRIVLTTEYQAALAAAGLSLDGRIPDSFTNYLVAGSLISGGTGEHLGQTNFVPSLSFTSLQALTTFLIGMVNPVAAFAYMVATDQFSNKHASDQVSQALQLLAGAQDSTTPGADTLKLTPKITGYAPFDELTGTSKPIYSQTEFDVTDAAGTAQGTVKFSGAGGERTMEKFDAAGRIKSTTTFSASGTVTIRPIDAPSLELAYTPDVQSNADGTITLTTKDALGQVLSTRNTQTYYDGSRLETTTTPDGKVIERSFDTDGRQAGTITDTPDGAGGMNREIATVVNGKPVVISQHASPFALEGDNYDSPQEIAGLRDSATTRQLMIVGDARRCARGKTRHEHRWQARAHQPGHEHHRRDQDRAETDY